ncbi:MAG: cupin domain-containing protein [Clostridiales bacterium]|nr:cupin domain-containing protein [Clostridiales bacterium]
MSELNLGQRIRIERMAHSLSIRKLAQAAGITPSMLSQIENEQVNPSIQTLRSLAKVMDIPLYSFFQEEAQVDTIVTPENRMTIGRKTEPDVIYELLTPDTQGTIEFCMMIIPPGASSNNQAQSHKGEETAFFHAGKVVELEMAGNIYSMKPGDSVRIPADCPHRWRNPTDEVAQVIFALSPPSF